MIHAAHQHEALLRWMSSLSDPTRLRLLLLLERRELGVSELCSVLQMPQSTVSRHLKLLSGEGWLVMRRSGTTNLYSMVLDELADSQRQDWPTVRQDELRLNAYLSRHRSGTQAFFADAAERWDQLRHELYGSRFGFEAVLGMIPSEWIVADLGCGTGALAAELARQVQRVIGIDNSDAMLDAAARRTADLDNVDLMQGDLEDLPLEDQSCDAALIVLVLTYLPRVELALAQATRILKPGGRLVVIDLLRHDREDFRRELGQAWPGFEPDELTGMFEAAGIYEHQCRMTPPDPEAKAPALLAATGMRTLAESATN